MAQTYKDLLAWQRAMDLLEDLYVVTRSFPKSELYCLTSQMHRAAVSVPCNIAEGHGRLTWGERRQFLSNARGSILELETQILIAERLRYIASEKSSALQAQVNEIGRLVNGLVNSTRARGASA